MILDMTPAEFAREVVIPTVEAFRADRTSRRWSYLSALAVYHLRDHLAEALTPGTSDRKQDREAVGKAAAAVDATVRATLPSSKPFDVVEAVAIGSKHGLTRSPRAVNFISGSDWERTSALTGNFQAGLSQCGDRTGGREIEHDGVRYDLYAVVQATLSAFLTSYPGEFAGCTFDPYPLGY